MNRYNVTYCAEHIRGMSSICADHYNPHIKSLKNGKSQIGEIRMQYVGQVHGEQKKTHGQNLPLILYGRQNSSSELCKFSWKLKLTYSCSTTLTKLVADLKTALG